MFDRERLGNIDAALDRIVAEGFVPGNALRVMRGGKTVYEKFTGVTHFGGGNAPDAKTRWRLFSMTKPVLATAVLQLWEKGAFDLTDPLSKFLPDFADMQVLEPDGSLRPASAQINIRHLLTMTSGLAYDSDAPGAKEAYAGFVRDWDRNRDSWDTVRTMSELARVPLLFEPGEGYCYGLSHDVLGAVVEVVSGLNLSDYCRKHIFDPLGMTDTGFTITDETGFAGAYLFDDNGLPHESTDIGASTIDSFMYGPVYFSGGAGLWSTLDDYCIFADALYNNGLARNGRRILGRNTVKMMSTPHLSGRPLEMYAFDPDGDPCAFGPSFNYGLGVRINTGAVHGVSFNPVGEWGWAGAMGTWLQIDPAEDLCFVYMHQHAPACHAAYLPKLLAALYSALE